MNSSTSDSEPAASGAWDRWLKWFAAILLGGFAFIYLFVVIVDPYSTGRLTPFTDIDIAISWRHLSNAGRVRDSRFDAAVFGNSRAVRFDPSHLDELTGRRFVQLSVVATGPKEQLAIASAFLRAHRGQPLMLLWGLDHLWCHGQNEAPTEAPNFPYWLYGEGRFDYLRHIFSSDAIQASFHRLGIRLLKAPAAGAADGRPEPQWRGAGEIAAAQQKMRNGSRPTASAGGPPVRFPTIERLAEFVGQLPADVANVFVFQPYYVSVIPEPGSPAAAALAACKMRVSTLAGTRPRSVMVDWMRDDELARDPDNFWDEGHPKDKVMRALELDIGRAIGRGSR